MVRLEKVSKTYGRGGATVRALNEVSLEVAKGEFLVVMGPSGSGKSTLLHLLAGLDAPSSGEIYLDGTPISRMSDDEITVFRRRNIGFVFQFYHLLPVLTAYENVELPLLLLPLSASQRRQQVEMVLELVGLKDRMHHRPGQLSGGQQQRVGIARALVTDPALILADEPTGDLDARSAEEILDLLVELQRSLQKTIILVTHDPRAAARAERILHLDKGRLVDHLPVEPPIPVRGSPRRAGTE